MTVVVALGTDHHPFRRLLEWVVGSVRGREETVFVQHGATPLDPALHGVDYLLEGELKSRMDAASAVVCHGGPGTIALARRCGHVPIVVPRDPALGEHVDDHQMRYTAVLARSGAIEIATSAAELGRLLSTPRPRHVSEADSASAEAAAEFAALVDLLLDDRLPRRTWRQRLMVRRSG